MADLFSLDEIEASAFGTPDEVRALVEVVKAVQQLTAADGWQNADAELRLRVALARFDHG